MSLRINTFCTSIAIKPHNTPTNIHILKTTKKANYLLTSQQNNLTNQYLIKHLTVSLCHLFWFKHPQADTPDVVNAPSLKELLKIN